MDRDLDKPLHKAGVQSDSDPFEFVLSDETVDRHGDIVRASGWDLKGFRKNPIALFGHAHDQILGVWKNVRVEGKRLIGRLQLAEEGTSALVDTTRRLIEQRILRAVSVGFQALEYEARNADAPWKGIDIKQAALHEVSVVAVPANPNALALAKACSPNPDILGTLLVRTDEATPESLETFGRLVTKDETPNLDRARSRLERFDIY